MEGGEGQNKVWVKETLCVEASGMRPMVFQNEANISYKHNIKQ